MGYFFCLYIDFWLLAFIYSFLSQKMRYLWFTPKVINFSFNSSSLSPIISNPQTKKAHGIQPGFFFCPNPMLLGLGFFCLRICGNKELIILIGDVSVEYLWCLVYRVLIALALGHFITGCFTHQQILSFHFFATIRNNRPFLSFCVANGNFSKSLLSHPF